ncbi:uncharacterized protein LOC131232784 [Magnolia sinica]|uniref:uncharacterized protein LOC131232784 n=1 Tax=Magnolia sinica TaxID=86752 RepID=UPI00265B4F5A|nr:uncharacterized protein LOC131232784 [Magnolia sinica]
MNGALLVLPDILYDQTVENITTTFFKCTRWQFEETTDPINCPYHYFCDSTYAGNYPPLIDFSVLFFFTASFLLTVAFTVSDIKRSSTAARLSHRKRRYWLPSGPVALPFILLAFAKGHRINTAFPLSNTGPAILQLVLVSALAFENMGEKSMKYVLFEASTVSGILHASLYLDSVILPYYTGLEAIVLSSFSGECGSCVCRREALIAGGSLVLYRGWSATTFSVVGTLCSRMVCALVGEDRGSGMMKKVLEGLGWILISADAVYLIRYSPRSGFLEQAAYGGVCVLILLQLLKKMCNMLGCTKTFRSKEIDMELQQSNSMVAGI